MSCRPSIRSAAVAAAFLVVALSGCSDSSEPARPAPAVTGTVVDADGLPVADAAVVLDLDFVSGPADPQKPQAAIAFSLSEPGRVSVRITDTCDAEVYYAFDDSLAAGAYRITWDGTDLDGRHLVEGFFHARIEFAGHEAATHTLAVARNLDAETGEFATVGCAVVRDTWRVAAWTDAEGRFRIARDCWEFGESMAAAGENGTVTATLTVAPRVRVWAYPADRPFGAVSAWVDFDAVAGAEATVALPAAVGPRG